jgi:hypothetical protein
MQKEGGKAPPFGGGKTAFSIEQAQEPKTTLSRSTLNSRSILNSLFLSLSFSLPLSRPAKQDLRLPRCVV